MKLEVIVKPNSKFPGIDIVDENKWIIKVRERAIEGKANDAVIESISEKLNISKSKVTLIRGGKSKFKIFMVEDKC